MRISSHAARETLHARGSTLTSHGMRRLLPFVVALVALAPKLARGAERPRVRLDATATVDAETAARLSSAIESQVADVADVVTTSDARTIVVRLEKSGSDVVVSLVAPKGELLGKPRVLTGDDEVTASTAGAIVRAYLVATTTESRPPAAPEKAPPPPLVAPTPGPARTVAAAPATERAPLAAHLAPGTLRFGAYYTGNTLAPTVPWQNGVRLEASLRATRVVYAGLSYAFSPGITLSAGSVDVRVTRHFVGAFVGLETTGRPLSAAIDVGGGVDATLRSSTSVDERFSLTAATTHPSPVFAIRAHGRLRAPEGAGLALDIAPTFEAAPGGRALVIQDSTTTTLLAPSDARFRLDVGGTFDGF